MRERWTRRLLALALGTLALLAGCASSGGGGASPVSEQASLTPAGEQASVTPRAPGYRLRPGDLVEVTFPADPGAIYSTPITPDGTITLPMVGEVPAQGKTTVELADAISERMSQYLVDPSVSVMLREIGAQPVFVLGEVGKPGRVDSQGVITVSMALAAAGGIESTGRPSSVMVVRTYGVDQPEAFRVDVTKILSGRDLSEDVPLRPNDVVYVPKSFIGKVDEFVSLFFENIAPAQLFYLRGYDMMHLEGAEWRF